MTRLDGIVVIGFKSIAYAMIKLRPLNVLIGANGSGKSNFIDVFSFLRASIQGQLERYVKQAGGANRIFHFGTKVTSKLELQVSFDRNQCGFAMELSSDDSDGLYIDNLTFHPSGPASGKSEDLNWANVSNLPFSHQVGRQVDRWQTYHFHNAGATSPLKTTSDVNDNRNLRTDGSNLSSFLFLLKNKHEGSYAQIQRTVQMAAPFFEDFALEPMALNEDKIRLEWRHAGSDSYFDASSLSDGTLRFMALSTLLLQPVSLRPPVVLLDEPELGLHPFAITLLASMLKQASEESQIIVATQSPVLLDHIDPKDVIVADRVNRATTFERLDSKRLAAWLEEYSLGQLWEKNEIGGRPAVEDNGNGSLE
ncbi:MAG: AAA family ATPase [Gemmatimonadota bacterium]|nr:AAA family ATPase [Gemmatimonadota bacterium]